MRYRGVDTWNENVSSWKAMYRLLASIIFALQCLFFLFGELYNGIIGCGC